MKITKRKMQTHEILTIEEGRERFSFDTKCGSVFSNFLLELCSDIPRFSDSYLIDAVANLLNMNHIEKPVLEFIECDKFRDTTTLYVRDNDFELKILEWCRKYQNSKDVFVSNPDLLSLVVKNIRIGRRNAYTTKKINTLLLGNTHIWSTNMEAKIVPFLFLLPKSMDPEHWLFNFGFDENENIILFHILSHFFDDAGYMSRVFMGIMNRNSELRGVESKHYDFICKNAFTKLKEKIAL